MSAIEVMAVETQVAQEAVPAVYSFAGLQVRTVVIAGDPWFVAADACRILGISDGLQAIGRLDDDERARYKIPTPGGMQECSVISEAGIYSLILRSNKTEAKAFKRWVTHEVLPAIRKTGGYQIPRTLGDALLLAGKLQKDLEAAESKLALAAPKVEAFDSFMDASGLMTMQKAVKAIKGAPGRNKAFEILRKQKIIMQHDVVPYQRYVDDGYFVCKAKDHDFGPNKKSVIVTTFVTPKGLDFLRKRLGEQACA